MANPWGARKYDYPKTEVTAWRVDGISMGGGGKSLIQLILKDLRFWWK